MHVLIIEIDNDFIVFNTRLCMSRRKIRGQTVVRLCFRFFTFVNKKLAS